MKVHILQIFSSLTFNHYNLEGSDVDRQHHLLTIKAEQHQTACKQRHIPCLVDNSLRSTQMEPRRNFQLIQGTCLRYLSRGPPWATLLQRFHLVAWVHYCGITTAFSMALHHSVSFHRVILWPFSSRAHNLKVVFLSTLQYHFVSLFGQVTPLYLRLRAYYFSDCLCGIWKLSERRRRWGAEYSRYFIKRALEFGAYKK